MNHEHLNEPEEETRRQRLERLLFLLVTACTGRIDAVLLKKEKPEVDILISISGILTGHKVPIRKGFEELVHKAINKNLGGDWSKLQESVYNSILNEYGI